MNKREAKKKACHIVSILIDGQLGIGWDLAIHGESAEDTERIEAAIQDLRDEMYRRSL